MSDKEVSTIVKGPRKIKVLALCDSPTTATGFAQVSRNVLNGLAKTGKYDIQVLGINFHGDAYDKNVFPYDIYPAMPQGFAEMYGRDRMMRALNGHEARAGMVGPWDIIFTIQDPFVIEGLGLTYPFGEQIRVMSELWRRTVPAEQWFSWIGYFPVDAQMKENWVTRSVKLPQYPVMYCDYGKSEVLKFDKAGATIPFTVKITDNGSSRQARIPVPMLKDTVSVIPHGVDLEVFKPLPKEEVDEFKEKYFGKNLSGNKYLVVNISRNQSRKDISRTMAAFAAFRKKVPNAHLYLHCQPNDQGGSIAEMARNFDLRFGEDFSVPNDFSANIGYTVDIINKIYNAADLCITTTLGEGWGFMLTEAMATKTPIIAPNITSVLDIFNSYDYDGSVEALESSNTLRGIPAKAGSTSSEWICLGLEDNERIRPLTNVDDMVEKMLWAYIHKEKVKEMTERAYEWVKTLAWGNVVKMWDELFMKAFNELEEKRKIGQLMEKAGRNDLCPCGSGKKFKNCHGDEVKINKFSDWLEPEKVNNATPLKVEEPKND